MLAEQDTECLRWYVSYDTVKETWIFVFSMCHALFCKHILKEMAGVVALAMRSRKNC